MIIRCSEAYTRDYGSPPDTRAGSGVGKLATRKGRDANQSAQEVLSLYLEHEGRFIEAVKRGLESLDRGEYVSHEEVGARIDRLFPS